MDKLYNDPRFGLSNLNSFFIRAKDHGFTRKEISTFLARQAGYQINKQQPQTPYFPIWGNPGTFQADTLDMGIKEYRGWRYILNIINVNTRKAWAIPCKRKSEESDKLLEWLKEHKEVKVFQVDLGTEFSSKIDSYCSLHGIVLRKVPKGRSTDQAKVERFNGTLRRLMTMYCSVFKTDDWVSDLPKLMENYNSRFCVPLGMSPDEATETTSDKENLKQWLIAERQFDKIAIGQRVRKLIHKYNVFSKGRKRWSQQVYTVKDIQHHQFILDNGEMVKAWEVQPIADGEPETPAVEDVRADEPTVIKKAKAKRTLNKEGVKDFLTAGPAEVIKSNKRQAKTPEEFIAEPSNRKALKPQREAELAKVKKQGVRIPKFVQKYENNKWIRGKVLGDQVKFLDGSTSPFTLDLLKTKALYRFPLDSADKKALPKLLPQLAEL